MANPLLVRPEEDVFGGLMAGMTPKEAGNLGKSGVEYAGGLLDDIAQKAPGSLRRAWEGSDVRQKAQEALDTVGYYAGPHLSNRAEAVANVIPAVTPKFGTEDARAAGEAFKAGKVGRGAGLMGLGVAGGLLDALPGEAAVKGLLKGLTKAAHYTPDLSMAIAPIKAFHGSPYDFEKFDIKKIGTGEGAQAYGHGLYFAGNEATARQYRDKLTGARVGAAQRALGSGDPDEAIARVMAEMDHLRNLPNSGGDPDRLARQLSIKQAKIDELNALKSSGGMSQGRMYEVGIHADPEKLLDWDKPVIHQPEPVQAALRSMGYDPQEAARNVTKPPTGGTIYKAWDPFKPGEASKAYQEAGIPGIKYLDQGSRGAGEGSRNYVTFSDDIVEILRKYGLAGAGVGLGGAMAMQPGLFPLPQQQ